MTNNRKTRETAAIREAVLRIDCHGLIAGGAPLDEFDAEIHAIVRQLPRCKTVKDLSHAIERVLRSSFGEKLQPECFEDEASIIASRLGWV